MGGGEELSNLPIQVLHLRPLSYRIGIILPTPTHINTLGPSLKALHSTPPRHPHTAPPPPQSSFVQKPPPPLPPPPQTCWKAGGLCTQAPMRPHLQAHRWFSRGGEDTAEALSTEVWLSCAAAARGDLKDSLFSVSVVTLGLTPHSFLPTLKRGWRVGEMDQTVTPPPPHPPQSPQVLQQAEGSH